MDTAGQQGERATYHTPKYVRDGTVDVIHIEVPQTQCLAWMLHVGDWPNLMNVLRTKKKKVHTS
jgi:hypothetical protein